MTDPTSTGPAALMALSEELARAAGDHVRARTGDHGGVARTKSSAVDVVTAVDEEVEVLLREREQGPARLLRGLESLDRGIPRAHMRVSAGGADVGEVTSGTFSPTIKQGIALALVDSRFGLDDEVGVQVRNRVEKFRIVKPPFVTPGVRES